MAPHPFLGKWVRVRHPLHPHQIQWEGVCSRVMNTRRGPAVYFVDHPYGYPIHLAKVVSERVDFVPPEPPDWSNEE